MYTFVNVKGCVEGVLNTWQHIAIYEYPDITFSILLVTKTTKQNAKLQKAKISLPIDVIQLQILYAVT
jgi:hypothetical protein